MIFDGHSDIFTDVTVRRLKGETQVLKNHHLPRLRKGNIEGCLLYTSLCGIIFSQYRLRLPESCRTAYKPLLSL